MKLTDFVVIRSFFCSFLYCTYNICIFLEPFYESYIALYTLPCTKTKFPSFPFLDNQKNALCRSVKMYNKADKILNTKGYVKVYGFGS